MQEASLPMESEMHSDFQVEKSLDNKEYLCSDRFTLADICVSYAINLAAALGIEQAFKPNIKRWSENL